MPGTISTTQLLCGIVLSLAFLIGIIFLVWLVLK
jgi:hypothetical protein